MPEGAASPATRRDDDIVALLEVLAEGRVLDRAAAAMPSVQDPAEVRGHGRARWMFFGSRKEVEGDVATVWIVDTTSSQSPRVWNTLYALTAASASSGSARGLRPVIASTRPRHSTTQLAEPCCKRAPRSTRSTDPSPRSVP